MSHFNRTPKRRAEFITPPNTLKAKAGSGGLSDDIIEKAQKLLEENTLEFEPLAMMYLKSLEQGIEVAKGYASADETESVIAMMIYPAVQLKANGGMFKYHLVTQISDQLIQLLEVIDEPDIEAVEIILAFYTSIKAVVNGKIMGDGGQTGTALLSALRQACERYLDRHPPIGFV